MHSTKEIIQDAAALPVEERIIIVDYLLRTLNIPNQEIDSEWGVVAKCRLEEIRSGRVVPVQSDKVFSRIREQFLK